MAYRVNHYNKKNGVTYVYESTSIWDKDKKQPISKRVCIGKLDPVTGDLIPSKRLNTIDIVTQEKTITATALIVGPYLLLETITKELEIKRILKKCFPEHYMQILSIVYFLVHKGDALSHCENWCKGHIHPTQTVLASQDISKMLSLMDESSRQSFFKEWSRAIIEREYLCYDITSVSSYSEQNEYVKYGYNRDKEKLPQINMAMLFGQESRLPVYYKRLPGNVTDVTTLSNLIKTMDFLENKKPHLVLDKGFYSIPNICELFKEHHKFTLGVSVHIKWVQEVVDEFYTNMHDLEYYKKINGEALYTATKLYSWGDDKKRSYIHLYYNPLVVCKV